MKAIEPNALCTQLRSGLSDKIKTATDHSFLYSILHTAAWNVDVMAGARTSIVVHQEENQYAGKNLYHRELHRMEQQKWDKWKELDGQGHHQDQEKMLGLELWPVDP